jgi:hypothetical protein
MCIFYFSISLQKLNGVTGDRSVMSQRNDHRRKKCLLRKNCFSWGRNKHKPMYPAHSRFAMHNISVCKLPQPISQYFMKKSLEFLVNFLWVRNNYARCHYHVGLMLLDVENTVNKRKKYGLFREYLTSATTRMSSKLFSFWAPLSDSWHDVPASTRQWKDLVKVKPGNNVKVWVKSAGAPACKYQVLVSHCKDC